MPPLPPSRSRWRPRSGSTGAYPDTTHVRSNALSGGHFPERVNRVVGVAGLSQWSDDIALEIWKITGDQIGFRAGRRNSDVANGSREQN